MILFRFGQDYFKFAFRPMGARMNSRKFLAQLIVLTSFVLSSCSTHSPLKNSTQASRNLAQEQNSSVPLVETLPKLTTDNGELLVALKKALKNRTKGQSDEALTKAATRLQKYLFFLGLSAKDLKTAVKPTIAANEEVPVLTEVAPITKTLGDDSDTGGEVEDNIPSNLKAIQRLFIASTQFLDCTSMIDWECLEKAPEFTPTASFRVERSDLGKPIRAGASLDMDVYFSQAWDGSPSGKTAEHFADKIKTDADKSLSLALYGIDDIQGSMSGVYNAIADRAATPGVDVKAVVDVMGFEKGSSPWVFSYRKSLDTEEKWVFGPSINPENPEGMRMTFQYSGTPNFLRAMNDGITKQEDSRARIEWSTARIMHNKFAVMVNENDEKSVWTGTANISKNCMGVEANANMSVYIKNDHVAQAYLDQFNLMFDFDKTIKVKSKLTIPESNEEPSMAGRFHRNKFPVNNRFFKFDDGTNLRVHFAPTDDAEHRVIIPMLLSARAGDLIRIAMFGGTGYEIVRAMQYAVAQGANIQIAFDRKLGHGLTSWIRDAVLNVHMPNPYITENVKPGAITVRLSTWTGKNHYKAGTLTRKQSDGSMKAEQIIVGSQNWSSGGNDFNDENLISIQNLEDGVKSAELFNHEFDTRLWEKSKEVKPRIAKPIL